MDENFKEVSAVLAMPEFPSPHTAVRIRELTDQVCRSNNLPDDVSLIVTDNASNMICAFKEDRALDPTDEEDNSACENEDLGCETADEQNEDATEPDSELDEEDDIREIETQRAEFMAFEDAANFEFEASHKFAFLMNKK